MTFVLTDTLGRDYMVENAVSYELIDEVGASCKGLRLYFDTDCELGEIVCVKAENDGNLVFNGFCDLQKESRVQSGFEYFIYARSLASILVDNEAEPFEYKNPTAKQLFISNIRQFGFKCALPDIFTENSYIVSKGASCFGAVNDFIFMMTGFPVYVDENGSMRVYGEGKKVRYLDGYHLLSQEYIISRSSVISRVDYKINASEGYKYHCTGSFAEQNKIQRSGKINLSGLPVWQREKAAERKITASLDEYYSLKIRLSGVCGFHLFDRVKTDKGEFFVSEIIYAKNEKGETTTLVMKRKPEGKMMNYVA